MRWRSHSITILNRFRQIICDLKWRSNPSQSGIVPQNPEMGHQSKIGTELRDRPQSGDKQSKSRCPFQVSCSSTPELRSIGQLNAKTMAGRMATFKTMLQTYVECLLPLHASSFAAHRPKEVRQALAAVMDASGRSQALSDPAG